MNKSIFKCTFITLAHKNSGSSVMPDLESVLFNYLILYIGYL